MAMVTMTMMMMLFAVLHVQYMWHLVHVLLHVHL